MVMVLAPLMVFYLLKFNLMALANTKKSIPKW
jgi:hypothetical protein